MAITRTTDTDDDGTGTTGTIHNNAWLQAIYAAIESSWALDTYSPSWTGSGSNPAIGNGSITGKYINLGGKCVHFAVKITAGSTTTFGTGNYSVSLPVTADTAYLGNIRVHVQFVSGGGGLYVGSGTISTTTTTALFVHNASGTYATAANVTPTVPVTLANTDIIWVFGTYFRS